MLMQMKPSRKNWIVLYCRGVAMEMKKRWLSYSRKEPILTHPINMGIHPYSRQPEAAISRDAVAD